MIKLAKPQFSRDALSKSIAVLKSGNLVQGVVTRELEEKIESYFNIKHGILVSSGTAALHISLLALGIEKGDEVIAPAFTFPATTNVIELVGGETVLVDINLSDFCINTDVIEEKITKKTKAIMVVHEFGQPAKLDRLMEIARKYKLAVIEDAACALGAKYCGKNVGTFGALGCFSLHPRKAITSGEGGIVITEDDKLALKIRALRNHGIVYEKGNVNFLYAGLNYRITDFQSALVLDQMKHLDQLNKLREKQVQRYIKGFNANSYITVPAIFSERFLSSS